MRRNPNHRRQISEVEITSEMALERRVMGGVRLDEALDAVLYRRRGYF